MHPNKIKSKAKFWKAFLIQRFKKASDNQLDFQQILDYKVQTTHVLKTQNNLTNQKKKKKKKNQNQTIDAMYLDKCWDFKHEFLTPQLQPK